MRRLSCVLSVLFVSIWAFAKPLPVSSESETCIECHSQVTPGIVESWKKGAHAHITVGDALKKDSKSRLLSSKDIPKKYLGQVVGCAECHTVNPKSHKDSFEHNGFMVHVIVTPRDCATCHSKEVKEFEDSLMGHAYDNLMDNRTYHKLVKSIDNSNTPQDSCLECHGTKIKVRGMKTVETQMGDMQFPVLDGWPNQGVGRINPDGSRGSCTSCHTRHAFKIAEARSPHACERCHKGPDVPVYKIYTISKHGAIFKTSKSNMNHVPWVPGKDFDAPTCATCHMSKLATADGETIVPRTHDPAKRLWIRLFGLPYSHPYPATASTSGIKNADGLYLITNLDGSAVKNSVIDKSTAKQRMHTMGRVCSSCHSTSWTKGHFAKITRVARESDKKVKEATELMKKAWNIHLADPSNPFDEFIERLWVRTWLYYANSVRLSAAMGGADYGVFERGREYLTTVIAQMRHLLNIAPSKTQNSKAKQ